jgi:hypothetical protein
MKTYKGTVVDVRIKDEQYQVKLKDGKWYSRFGDNKKWIEIYKEEPEIFPRLGTICWWTNGAEPVNE